MYLQYEIQNAAYFYLKYKLQTTLELIGFFFNYYVKTLIFFILSNSDIDIFDNIHIYININSPNVQYQV